MAKTVSIIGIGWLGFPLAEQLITHGYKVWGSVTSTEKVARLQQRGITAVQLQLNPQPVGNLAGLLQADTLVINVPPKAGKMGDAFHPQQIQHLTEAIRQSPVEHVIYVSSTSVYPELNRVVTEADVTTEAQSATPMLIRAERLVQALAPERTVTVLRYGGLMGYDRIPGKYVAGRTVDSGDIPVNYLHRDDAVGILETMISQKLTGIFNGVAPEHPAREAIYQKSCTDFGYPLPTFVRPKAPVAYKIISPDQLLQATGYAFRYPDPLQFLYKLDLRP